LIKVKTDFGVYISQEMSFIPGIKKINQEQSFQNLIMLCTFFESKGLFFGVIYGTLLGLYRDGALIPWDEDTDMFILEKDKKILMNSLFDLRALGFELVRKDGGLLSFSRMDEYTDIYIFSKKRTGGYSCNFMFLQDLYFDGNAFLYIGDYTIPTVNHIESFLTNAYGPDWMVPIKNRPANVNNFIGSAYFFLSPLLPKFIIKILKLIVRG